MKRLFSPLYVILVHRGKEMRGLCLWGSFCEMTDECLKKECVTYRIEDSSLIVCLSNKIINKRSRR